MTQILNELYDIETRNDLSPMEKRIAYELRLFRMYPEELDQFCATLNYISTQVKIINEEIKLDDSSRKSN